MIKFALLALINLPNGHIDAYVIDSGLTADDCRSALHSPLPADLPASLAARLGKARLACEPDE